MSEPRVRTTFVLDGYRVDATMTIDPAIAHDQAWLEAVLAEASVWRTTWRWSEKVTLTATEHNIVTTSREEGQCLD